MIGTGWKSHESAPRDQLRRETSVADGTGTRAGSWHGCHFSHREGERDREWEEGENEIKGILSGSQQTHGRRMVLRLSGILEHASQILRQKEGKRI